VPEVPEKPLVIDLFSNVPEPSSIPEENVIAEEHISVKNCHSRRYRKNSVPRPCSSSSYINSRLHVVQQSKIIFSRTSLLTLGDVMK
jgi:hypothetical protein